MTVKAKGRAYSALSPYYEYLISDSDYKKWSDCVCGAVKKYSPSKNGADIACGSGYFTRALKKCGFDVFGYDISEEMLSEARRISASEGIYIEFLSGNIKSFKSLKKLGFVTAINDGYNYLKDEELEKSFKSVYKNLSSKGVFMFDISSEYKLKNVVGNNVFSVDEDDLTYIWFNRLFEDRVQMDVTVFARAGNFYERKDETHVQYIHKADEVLEKLKSAGFQIEKICDITGKEISETTDRICFVAIKR